MFKIALRIPLGRDLSPHRHVPLHARSSPRTRQIRDATAQTGLTTLLLQVMRRTRSAPVCPSTQPVAGVTIVGDFWVPTHA